MNIKLTKILMRLKNASQIQKKIVIFPFSKFFIKILKILYTKGLILNFIIEKETIKVFLRYYYNLNTLKNLKIVSTPTKSLYLTYHNLCNIYEKHKILILSTPRGFLTSLDCKKQKIGGKLIVIF